ncbi:Spy/CpxP family protein refolding chaperone [Candidatus Omnitrophota bacterium]
MNRRFKEIAVFGMAAAMALMSVSAYAQAPKGSGQEEAGGKKKMMIENLVEELGLTPEQQQQLKEQRAGCKEGKKGARKELKAARSQLRQELEKEVIDKEKIDSLVSQIKTLSGQMLDNKVEGVLAMRQILTHEQYTKFREKMKEKRKKHKKFAKKKGKKGSACSPFKGKSFCEPKEAPVEVESE